MAGITQNGNGRIIAWIMGIIAVLFTAGLIGSASDIKAQINSTRTRVDMLEQSMTEQRIDIRYIKEAVKEMRDEQRGQWPPAKGN